MTLVERVAMMKRQRERDVKEGEKERRSSPHPPAAMAIQSTLRRSGLRQTSAHYPSTSPPITTPAACNSAKEQKRECEADAERVKIERARGRPRGSGSYQHPPLNDRTKLEESHMISLSPTVQQLLNPVGHFDTAPYSVPPKREMNNTFSPISR